MAALLAIAWAFSEDRRRIPWRTVARGVALQWVLALVLIGFPPATTRSSAAERRRDRAAGRDGRPAPASCSAISAAAPLPFAETHPGASFILAFQALPLVLVISALASLLFHWGVLQRITAAFAWLLRRVMGIGGALALGAAVHVFVGMIEAPLLVRPYLARMQRGELFALMTCGMAGVAGTVMVIYAAFLAPVVPNALGNILIASVISTPAALAIAALMVPFGPAAAERGAPRRCTTRRSSALDAMVKGTLDGIPDPGRHRRHAAGGGGAGGAGQHGARRCCRTGAARRSRLQRLFAWPFRPVMWLIGIPWAESAAAAALMAHQDGAERVRRLSRPGRAAGGRASARMRG